MCGRYVTVTRIREVESRFGVTAPFPDLLVPSANVSAGQAAPVITSEKPGELQFYQFGFTPFWAKKNMYVLNARCEGDHNPDDDALFTGARGILEKPMFRKAIRSQRCLVIADAVIEGPKEEKLAKPYCVYLRNGRRPFAMAGIWDRWINEGTGEVVNSFAILTTAANELMRRIGHHRCPLILHPHQEKVWIELRTPLSEITAMMLPFPAEEMNAYPISAEIRSPKNRELSLLAPVGPRVFSEHAYEVYDEIRLFGMGESRARDRRKNEG
jgi:putative SOS response-associated peptidase YedK